MKALNLFTVWLSALTLLIMAPTGASAATLEVTKTMKTSLDKMMTDPTSSQAEQIRSQYNELLSLQEQSVDWDSKTKALHAENGKTYSFLSKQLKEVDASKLDKLKADITKAKDQYQPLCNQYTSLNKQITLARLFQSKTLSSQLRAQAEALKFPIQLARMDIDRKEELYKDAKDNNAKTVKQIRSTLAGTESVNQQIKAKQTSMKSASSRITPVWNQFKEALKQKSNNQAYSSLAFVNSLFRQLNEEKQSVYQLEVKISEIYAAAKAQLP